MGTHKKPFLVNIHFTVKTYDIDAAHHVSNIVYIRWLEDLRFRILEEYLPLDRLMEKSLTPVILRTEINYIQAVKLFDNPTGMMWMEKLENLRFYLAAEFTVGGKVVCDARQTGVFIDIEKQRPSRIPPELLKIFKESVW